ncbi:MAG: hypothetical protein AB2L24_31725 [Mangrovibacterium sp.]
MKMLYILIILILHGCLSTRVEGIYTCEKSIDEKISTGKQLQENFDTPDCLCEKIEFIGKSTVIVTTCGINIPTSYVVDGNYVRITMEKSDWLFTIENSHTLTGQINLSGTFRKISE